MKIFIEAFNEDIFYMWRFQKSVILCIQKKPLSGAWSSVLEVEEMNIPSLVRFESHHCLYWSLLQIGGQKNRLVGRGQLASSHPPNCLQDSFSEECVTCPVQKPQMVFHGLQNLVRTLKPDLGGPSHSYPTSLSRGIFLPLHSML